MTQPTDPTPAYDVPYYPGAVGEPSSPKVIGILAVIFGSLSLLLTLGAIAFAAATAVATHKPNPAATPLQAGLYLVEGLASLAELVGGVGCLRRSEWGRSLLVGWAIASPLIAVVGAILAIAFIIPATLAQTNTQNVPPQTVAAMAYGGQALGVVIRFIFPAFVLVYLRRPAVRAVFTH